MKVIFEEDVWEPLVEILRDELQESGALYKMLNDQRNYLRNRDVEGAKEIEVCIDEQIQKRGLARKKREALIGQLAAKAGVDRKTPLLNLLLYFPEFVRPLLEAMAIESDQMMVKIRWRGRQNRLLRASMALGSTKKSSVL